MKELRGGVVADRAVCLERERLELVGSGLFLPEDWDAPSSPDGDPSCRGEKSEGEDVRADRPFDVSSHEDLLKVVLRVCVFSDAVSHHPGEVFKGLVEVLKVPGVEEFQVLIHEE